GRRERALHAAEVQGQAQQAAVPTDPGRARAEGLPHLSGDVGDAAGVLELEAGALAVDLAQAHCQPRHGAHGLPGGGELGGTVRRRLAGGDLAARVALELVAAAEAEV